MKKQKLTCLCEHCKDGKEKIPTARAQLCFIKDVPQSISVVPVLNHQFYTRKMGKKNPRTLELSVSEVLRATLNSKLVSTSTPEHLPWSAHGTNSGSQSWHPRPCCPKDKNPGSQGRASLQQRSDCGFASLPLWHWIRLLQFLPAQFQTTDLPSFPQTANPVNQNPWRSSVTPVTHSWKPQT